MRYILKIVLFIGWVAIGCFSGNSSDIQNAPVYLDFISHFDGTEIIEINGELVGKNEMKREYQWYEISDHLESINKNTVTIKYHGLNHEFKIDLQDSARYYNIYYSTRIRNGIIMVKNTRNYMPRF